MSQTYINTDECWLFAGNKDQAGYGSIWRNNKNLRAHRVTYENFKGEIPEGYHIDHLCRTPPCINPDHLEAVTPRENVLRGIGVAAKSAKRSACIHGHTYTEANTYMRRNNRVCRTCAKEWAREYLYIKRNRNKILIFIYCALYKYPM